MWQRAMERTDELPRGDNLKYDPYDLLFLRLFGNNLSKASRSKHP
jgi:hypothetical protein